MFGFGHGPELIIILVIALIVLGPGKIPEVAQMLGKAVRELRKASADLQQTFDVNQLVNQPAAPETPAASVAPPPAVSVAPAEATIAPPASLKVKPKPARKRAAVAAGTETPAVSRRRTRPVSASGKAAPAAGAADGPTFSENAEPPAAKPAARRRPSKPPSETVSLDAPA